MSKIIRLTENDLIRLVNRVIKEQEMEISMSEPGTYRKLGTEREPQQMKQLPQGVVRCSSIGVKYEGYCEQQTKQPVIECAKLGIKTPGFCYVSNKQPMGQGKPMLPGRKLGTERTPQQMNQGIPAQPNRPSYQSIQQTKASTKEY